MGDNLPGSLFNLFTLSATVSYTLDLFGGERRAVEGLGAEVDVARATERATYLSLSANIVNTVIARAAYRAEIEATEQLIALEKQQVEIADVQTQAGTVPYSNLLTLRSQLASVEATIPALAQKLTQADDLLATLAGHTPAEWRPPEVALAGLTFPRELPVSLPSDLVRQRPDILAAEATAHAASANIGIATAALLPSVTLSGSYGANNTSVSNLFAANGTFWGIGANATAPLFEGGTLWFKRKAAIDAYQQAMAAYRQTVLNAFGQVADTLAALDHDAAVLRADDDALEAAQQALHLVQVNYQAGITTYLDVLVADTQYTTRPRSPICKRSPCAIRTPSRYLPRLAAAGGTWSTLTLARAKQTAMKATDDLVLRLPCNLTASGAQQGIILTQNRDAVPKHCPT